MSTNIETSCAICNVKGNSTTLLDASTTDDLKVDELFSARRLPDRIHYRWVRCKTCKLLRSDPVKDVDLGSAYEKSTFDYSDELVGLTSTYLRIVRRQMSLNPKHAAIFEIGGGNGFFLGAAKDFGFKQIAGVEPSAEAISNSRVDVRPHLVQAMMSDGVLPQDHFDVGTMFHTLDHLSDPVSTLQSCMKSLKPGGIMVVAIHNVNSLSARLLRGASPIFDIEHTYLFSQNTARKLLEKAGYTDVNTGSYWNSYSLAYIIHLLPLPINLKKIILNSRVKKLLAKIPVVLPLGNIWVVGTKPSNLHQ